MKEEFKEVEEMTAEELMYEGFMSDPAWDIKRRKARHVAIYNSRCAKYLVNHGGHICDMVLNYKPEYKGRLVFYFIDSPALQVLIRTYAALYKDGEVTDEDLNYTQGKLMHMQAVEEGEADEIF